MFTQAYTKLFGLIYPHEVPVLTVKRSVLNGVEAAREAGTARVGKFHCGKYDDWKWECFTNDGMTVCHTPMDEKMVVYILDKNGHLTIAFMRMLYTNWREAPHGIFDSTEQNFMCRKANSRAAEGSPVDDNTKAILLASSNRDAKGLGSKISPFVPVTWDGEESKEGESRKAMTAAWLDMLKSSDHFEWFKTSLNVAFLPETCRDAMRSAIEAGKFEIVEANADDGIWGVTAEVRQIVEALKAAEKLDNIREFISKVAMGNPNLKPYQKHGVKNQLGEIQTSIAKRIVADKMAYVDYMFYLGATEFVRIVEDADKKRCV